MRTGFFGLLLVALLGLGPSAGAQAPSAETLCPLASALTKLARAVDAHVFASPETAGRLTGAELLRNATAHDPVLLAPFAAYAVTARVAGGNSAVLVCTADGSRSLLEDAGCTAAADAASWAADPPLPCGFTLDLDRVCALPAPPPPVTPCR